MILFKKWGQKKLKYVFWSANTKQGGIKSKKFYRYSKKKEKDICFCQNSYNYIWTILFCDIPPLFFSLATVYSFVCILSMTERQQQQNTTKQEGVEM